MTDAEMPDKLIAAAAISDRALVACALECHTPEGPSAEHDFAGCHRQGWPDFPKGRWGESQIGQYRPRILLRGLGQWSDDEIRRANVTQGIATATARKLRPPDGLSRRYALR